MLRRKTNTLTNSIPLAARGQWTQMQTPTEYNHTTTLLPTKWDANNRQHFRPNHFQTRQTDSGQCEDKAQLVVQQAVGSA